MWRHLISYEICPLGGFLIDQRHYSETYRQNLRGGTFSGRHTGHDSEECSLMFGSECFVLSSAI